MGDRNSLFSVEAFVDTVDYLNGFDESCVAKDAVAPLIAELAILFCDFPPLLVKPHKDTTISWVTTHAGNRRLRCSYSCGQAAFFEANPAALVKRLRAQPAQVLALGPAATGSESTQRGRGGSGHATEKRVLRGSGALPTSSFGPPLSVLSSAHGGAGGSRNGGQAGASGMLSASWGVLEHALPLRDATGRTVAVALVALSLSAVNGALRSALLLQQGNLNNNPPPQQLPSSLPQPRVVTEEGSHEWAGAGEGGGGSPSSMASSEVSGHACGGETVVPPRARR